MLRNPRRRVDRLAGHLCPPGVRDPPRPWLHVRARAAWAAGVAGPRGTAAAAGFSPANPSQLVEPALSYTDSAPAAVEAALRTVGAALLQAVLAPAAAAALAAELAGYAPLPHEVGMANNRPLPGRSPLRPLPGAPPLDPGGGLERAGAAAGSQNFLTLFPRDPAWLQARPPVSCAPDLA